MNTTARSVGPPAEAPPVSQKGGIANSACGNVSECSRLLEEIERLRACIAAEERSLREYVEQATVALQGAKNTLDGFEYHLAECQAIESCRVGANRPAWPQKKK